MNILCDFHHADLWWAMQLLANRLGATLYRPYGMEWYDEGYFKLYGNLRAKDPERWIAKQYLVDTLFDYNFDTFKDENIKMGRETYNDCSDYPLFKTLTLEQAKDMQIDIVICSVNENEPYFAKLKEFYPKAQFIRHVGNDLDTETNEELYPNLLASALSPYNKFTKNKVLYRQEFRMDIFQPEPITNFKNLWSFQNDIEQFEDTFAYWTDLKHKLREWDFKSYGVGNEQGKIYPKRELVKKMLECTFNLQSKGPWEGYGHTIHNSIALGRPMIIKKSDYQGRIAEPLLIENETYLEMDDQLPDKLRALSEEDIIRMSNACVKTFKKVVDFNQEFETQLKPFFDNLI